MSIVAFLIGTLFITAIGWLALRLLEGNAPVLRSTERICAGCILGGTLTAFVQFLLLNAGIVAITRGGVLVCQIVIIAALGGIALFLRRASLQAYAPVPAPSPPLPRWAIAAAVVLGLWIMLKIAAGTFLLTALPPFHDDVINNWNFRGKTLYYAQELTLTLERGYGIVEDKAVSSYPPSIPLLKANYAAVAGRWSEPLVNAMHMLWYACALLLLYCALRWHTTRGWALLGTYVLASLPLYLIHGSVAYADLWLSIHVLLALSFLLRAVKEADTPRRSALLTLFSFAAALTVFTKNEGFALYLPALTLLFAAAMWQMRRKTSLLRPMLTYALLTGAVAIPWLAYKWAHGLPFGNAKPVSLLDLIWHEGVLNAVWINTFLEGNWLLLFPVFLSLLALNGKQVLRSPLALIIGFLLLVYFFQLFLYLFTILSVEALYQTGYGRGIIQLLPGIVLMSTLMLAQFVWPRDT